MWAGKAAVGAIILVASAVGTVAAIPAPAVDRPATTHEVAVRSLQPIPGDQEMCAGRPTLDTIGATSVRMNQFDGNTADDPLIPIVDITTGQPEQLSWFAGFVTGASCDTMFFPHAYDVDDDMNRIGGVGYVDLIDGTYEFVPTDYEYGRIFPTIWGFVEVVESDGFVDLIDVFSDEVVYWFPVPVGYRVADVSLDAYSLALVPAYENASSVLGNTYVDPLLVLHAERDEPFIISDCLRRDQYPEVGFSPSGNMLHFESPCGDPANARIDGPPLAPEFSNDTRVHIANAWTGASTVIAVPRSTAIERRLFTDSRLLLCGTGIFDWTIGSSVKTVQPITGPVYLGSMCNAVR